eukprot:scaffold2216_cov72-Isochrysis_galbana.AAC.3
MPTRSRRAHTHSGASLSSSPQKRLYRTRPSRPTIPAPAAPHTFPLTSPVHLTPQVVRVQDDAEPDLEPKPGGQACGEEGGAGAAAGGGARL